MSNYVCRSFFAGFILRGCLETINVSFNLTFDAGRLCLKSVLTGALTRNLALDSPDNKILFAYIIISVLDWNRK